MTIERVLEIRGFGSGGTEILKLLPLDTIQPFLDDLSFWLNKYSGSVNYNKVKLADFELQPYVSQAWSWNLDRRTEIYCAIEHKVKTQNTLNSLVRLWPGPRNDYWVIVAELTALG